MKEGNCFEAAFKLAFDNSPMRDEMQIVHAIITALNGNKLTHAWVEVRGLVLDSSNMREHLGVKCFVSDKNKFYEMAKVDPMSVRFYSLEEAMLNVIKYEGCGPWENRKGDRTLINGKKHIVQ